MTFQDTLRRLENKFDIEASERARELGRSVAHLRD